MKHSKITILLAAALFICSGCSQAETANRFASYDFDAHSAEITYNENPDLNGKNDAPKSELADYIEMTFEEYIQESDLVIVGKPMDNGKEMLHNDDGLYYEPGSDIKSNDIIYPITVTLTEIQVEYVVCGELEIKTFTLTQTGKPQTNDVTVKVEKGKEYLMTLQNVGNGIYKCTVGNRSLFEIKEDFTVYSLSSEYKCAKYDGLPLADLVFDIENAFAEKTAETGADETKEAGTDDTITTIDETQ